MGRAERAVEDLVGQTNGILKLENTESLCYPLPLCSSEEEKTALDMWCILLDDAAWDGLTKLNRKEAVKSKMLNELRENAKMKCCDGKEFVCCNYEPFIVMAKKT